MKRFILFFALLFSGCAGLKLSPATITTSIRLGTGATATFVLEKNPKFVPACEAIVASIDAALTNSTAITPESIRSWLTTICTSKGLTTAETAQLVNIALQVYATYVDEYRPQVVTATNPEVRAYILAFKDGLNSAILAVK